MPYYDVSFTLFQRYDKNTRYKSLSDYNDKNKSILKNT